MVAVNDGTIKRIGHNSKLGNYVVLKDTYGNRFTYAQLGRVSKVYPVPKQRKLSASDFKLVTPKRDKAPTRPATPRQGAAARQGQQGPRATPRTLRQRLYALPQRPHNVDRADITGQLDQLLSKKFPGYETFKSYFGGVLHFNRDSMELRRLRKGSQVVAGTVLGRIGKTGASSRRTSTSPSGPPGAARRGSIPKPILDGWKLLEATAIYRAAGKNPFAFSSTNVAQILLMPKTQLERRVLADPRLSIYECGRADIRTGQIDQRVLAALEYLADNGFRPTVTSLKCGHSVYTSGGNISEHSTGDAMDIAEINGIPILGNQGRGSITEAVVQTLLRLQGNMQPHQLISLMDLGGPSFSMGDHADHIHVGYYPRGQAPGAQKQLRPAPEAGPVAAADRADRRDRQPEGPHLAVALLDPRGQAQAPPEAGQRRPPRRLSGLRSHRQ